MAQDLSDMFAQQESNVIEWCGGPVYGLYEFEQVPKRFTVEFLTAASSPVQGLCIKMRGGVVATNGVTATDLLIWRDTAPVSVEIEVLPDGKGVCSLKVWNVWRDGLGITQAWLRNAAMRVEDCGDDRSVMLYCSDGEGPPKFDDLVVRLNTR